MLRARLRQQQQQHQHQLDRSTAATVITALASAEKHWTLDSAMEQ